MIRIQVPKLPRTAFFDQLQIRTILVEPKKQQRSKKYQSVVILQKCQRNLIRQKPGHLFIFSWKDFGSKNLPLLPLRVRMFLLRTPFGKNCQARQGPARLWREKVMTFVSPTTPGEELERLFHHHGKDFVQSGENWWDETGPREKKCWLFSCQGLSGKNLLTFYPHLPRPKQNLPGAYP